MSDYIEIQATLPDEVEGGLAESLSGWPVLGVHVVAAENSSIKVGVWVKAGDNDLVEGIRAILAAFGSPDTREIAHMADDWSAEWRRNLIAFKVGRRWWIDPHPDKATSAPDGRFRLALEPRAAFGSGTHESTQLVLMGLETVNCRMIRVLDIGTGSGVLAVAADRLGATPVVALDTDLIAAWEARTTAARQPWRCRPLVVAGGVECLAQGRFDLILCNMILAEFGPVLGPICRLLATGGKVIMSGILECERGAVEASLEDCGLLVEDVAELSGWISLRAARPEGRS